MVFERIAAIILEQTDSDAGSVTMETSFEELGIDSLDTVEMVMKLEEELGVEIEMTEKLVTVGDLVAIIEARLQGASGG